MTQVAVASTSPPSTARRLPLPLIFGLLLGLNGLIMMLAPAWWYDATPGVAASGPFNAHFVRDIGAAFIAAGLALAMARHYGNLPRGLAYLPPAAFLTLHAVVHLFELAHHLPSGGVLAVELLAVYLPAALMLKPILRGLGERAAQALPAGAQIKAMEAYLGVPLDYQREVAAKAPHLFDRLRRISQMSREPAQVDERLRHFAALGAVLDEDCGTCVQIHVNLALKSGIAAEQLRAAIDGRLDALPEDLAAAFRFGRGLSAGEIETELHAAELQRRFGRAAVMELAFAAASARFYPALKRGLGYAKNCAQVRIDLAA